MMLYAPSACSRRPTVAKTKKPEASDDLRTHLRVKVQRIYVAHKQGKSDISWTCARTRLVDVSLSMSLAARRLSIKSAYIKNKKNANANINIRFYTAMQQCRCKACAVNTTNLMQSASTATAAAVQPVTGDSLASNLSSAATDCLCWQAREDLGIQDHPSCRLHCNWLRACFGPTDSHHTLKGGDIVVQQPASFRVNVVSELATAWLSLASELTHLGIRNKCTGGCPYRWVMICLATVGAIGSRYRPHHDTLPRSCDVVASLIRAAFNRFGAKPWPADGKFACELGRIGALEPASTSVVVEGPLLAGRLCGTG